VSAYDEERLAELIAALPQAPATWVQAAQELPRARAELDRIVARAQADAGFRQACSADLEAALARAGYAPDARSLAALRAHLSG